MDDAFYQAYFTYLDIQAASGIALPELALRWALPEERVHSVVTGFERWSDIAANIEAVGRGPLPADLQSRIDAIGIVQPLRYQGRTEL